jgi:hypothetical protein
VGAVYALARGHRLLWLLAWQALYFAAYASLRVSRYFWYYAPLVPGLIAAAGLGLDIAVRRLARSPARALWLGLLVLVGLDLALAPRLVTLSRAPDTRLAIYRAAGDWLRQMTPAAATVGTLEVGIIGYYSERPMVDFAGLIQPEVARQLSPASSYEVSAAWAVNTYRPDYIVVDPADYGYSGTINIYACDW